MSDALLYAAFCPTGQERQAAYGLLTIALEREYGISPLPKIKREEGGKPYFPDHPALHFNVSHSRGCAVCAVHSAPVGVDVELLRPAPRRVAKGMDSERFFRSWTAREATIKRIGRGWTALLHQVEPDPNCRHFPHLLPGCMVCLCTGEPASVQCERIRPEELGL